MSAGTSEGERRVSHPLELVAYIVMSCGIWVLGTECESCARTRRPFNDWWVQPQALFVNGYLEPYVLRLLFLLLQRNVKNSLHWKHPGTSPAQRSGRNPLSWFYRSVFKRTLCEQLFYQLPDPGSQASARSNSTASSPSRKVERGRVVYR